MTGPLQVARSYASFPSLCSSSVTFLRLDNEPLRWSSLVAHLFNSKPYAYGQGACRIIWLQEKVLHRLYFSVLCFFANYINFSKVQITKGNYHWSFCLHIVQWRRVWLWWVYKQSWALSVFFNFSEKAQAKGCRASLYKSPTFVQTFSLFNPPSSPPWKSAMLVLPR